LPIKFNKIIDIITKKIISLKNTMLVQHMLLDLRGVFILRNLF